MRRTALPTRVEYSYRTACLRPSPRTAVHAPCMQASRKTPAQLSAHVAVVAVPQSHRSVLFALGVAGGRRRDGRQDRVASQRPSSEGEAGEDGGGR